MEAQILWRGVDLDQGSEVPDENKWAMIRLHRNELLGRCDWTQLADAPLTLDEKNAWAAYRQTLRDLPELYATPDEVIFPTPPEGNS